MERFLIIAAVIFITFWLDDKVEMILQHRRRMKEIEKASISEQHYYEDKRWGP